MYKGHMYKTKGGKDQGWEVGMAGVGGSGGGENGHNCICTTIKKKLKKKEKNQIQCDTI